MLAYVFWHVPSPACVADYEARLRDVPRRAARGRARPGWGRRATVALGAVPWLGGAAGYEDWYLVEDFAALGTAQRAPPSPAPRRRRTTRPPRAARAASRG